MLGCSGHLPCPKMAGNPSFGSDAVASSQHSPARTHSVETDRTTCHENPQLCQSELTKKNLNDPFSLWKVCYYFWTYSHIDQWCKAF